MTAVAQPADVAPTIETSTQILIADISPDSDNASSYIIAQIALVWPYSSSTGTLALLLADPNIRRRKSRGQVKVIFRHGCARAVAETKVGIGDTIKLALTGCEWRNTGDAVSTPGKKIDWNLEYRRRVTLEVLRDDQALCAVNYIANDSDALPTNGALALLNGTYTGRPVLNGVLHRQPSTIPVPYLTPRKTPRNHSIGTFIDAALDGPVEDDGYVPGKGRKRTKFARNSGAWSLVDDETASQSPPGIELPEQKVTPLPLETDLTIEQDGYEGPGHIRADVQPLPTTNIIELSSSPPHDAAVESPPLSQPQAMGPPSTPLKALRLEFLSGEVDAPQASPSSDATTTPRLHPILSPGLPLISPLLQRTRPNVEYFPAFDIAAAQLDTSVDATAATSTVEGRSPVEADPTFLRSDDQLSVEKELSTLQKPGEDIEVGLNPPSDYLELNDDPMTEVEDPDGQHLIESHERKSLSPSEPKINTALHLHEQQDLQDATRASNPSKTIEVEDEDMYGAPDGTFKSNEVSANLPSLASVEIPKSPLDVLGQFLHMSPVTAAEPLTGLESDREVNVPITPVTPLEQLRGAAADTRQEKTILPGLKHSPVSYPESQSPFRQNREQHANSSSSSRPSSAYHTRLHSLDGTVDDEQPFAEYINHLAQIAATAGSVQLSSADYRPDRDKTREEMLPTVKTPPAHEVVLTEPAGSAAEDLRVQTEEAITAAHAAVTVAQPSPQPPITQYRSPAASDRLAPSHHSERQGQLLTPDQSQVQRVSPESEADTELQPTDEVISAPPLSPKQTQDEAPSQEEVPPTIQDQTTFSTQQDETTAQVSPNLELQVAELVEAESPNEDPSQSTLQVPATLSQEGDTSLEAIAEEETQILAEERAEDIEAGTVEEMQDMPPRSVEEKEQPTEATVEGAATMSAGVLNLPPDTTTSRRSSQRLSARKSIMTSNISSPYFTPRKSAQAPVSSPIRKENVHPVSQDRSRLLSPSAQEREKAASSPSALQDVEQNGSDIALSSPSKARRPASRRHTGTTTPLAYYAHLSSLHEHFGQVVDVLATCTDSSSKPERAKSGPKDYHTTLRIADPSLTSNDHSAIPVQLFRHAKSALASTSNGDVVILRNFKVQTVNRKFMLLSTETSSWAVFKAKPDSTMSWSDVVISGPPIEYGPAETSRIKLLFSWWNSNGKTTVCFGAFTTHPREFCTQVS